MELTPALQEKKIFLIEGLKKTYKDQYDAIQPLPYIKDRLYCVDKVFVEGGVEVCLAPELTRGTGGSWERLESYKSVYTDFRFQSKRRIIQGEPGYGKSTLTLQLAYDWCNDVSDSPMNNVEILILLRLRQLGRVKHLFGAIKSFLLSHEPRVSIHDIEKIIHCCSSVHITLDGYDEYPGRGSNDNDDVHRIIKMELFADFDVSLTTRYLPECLRKETKRAKLTGFDDKARDEYIRKAVVGNNDEAVEKIKQWLYENSILADLCQVPLIFVMFAHMAQDQREVKKFKSVTQFFKHIIRSFYDHLNRKRKLNDSRHNRFYLLEMEHHELDKIAFEGLNKKNQQLSWIKTEFRERVGPESYHQYILIGILVEEDVVSDGSTVDNVFTTEVRFYHKLFCEWYAAHHLVTLVKIAQNLKDTLRFLDPVDLQYLFRFACGLDPDAGKKLINHLKRLPGGDTFAILCILEQTGDIKDIMDSVKDLCSRDVNIKSGDHVLLQRSTTQLLEIASKNDIPISCLHLEYSSVKFEDDSIILHSGIPLPKLPTVEKIHIDGSNAQYGNTGTVTDKDIFNLFHYGLKCGRIKELMFSQLQLPTSVSPEAFTEMIKTRNIQVRWRPFDIDFHLDLQNGHWEVVDIRVLENIRFSTVSIDGRVLQQISTVQLLHVAHRHNIPISSLLFNESFNTTAHETIISNNGIQLTNLPQLQKMHVVNKDDCNTSEITEQDVVNILLCAMKDQHFNSLCFEGCRLPVSFSSSSFTNVMISRAIKVSWCPFDSVFHLNLKTGLWEVVNIQVLENIRCSTVSIDGRHSKLQQRSTVQLLHVAHRYNIPISCLHLDYSSIKFEDDSIILHSGIPLPKLPTVEKIHIDGSNSQYGNIGTVTDNDFFILFHYAMKCGRIKELMFSQLQMPNSVSPEAFTEMIKTWNIQVRWRPFDIDFHLDLQSGQWEVVGIQVLENIRCSTVSIDGRHSVLQQRSTVQLLHVASNHTIPISSLLFNESFNTTDNETIILNNGIQLTNLPPLQKIHDVDNNGCNAITDQDIANILLCVIKGQHFNEICFEGWLMPVFFSSSFTNWMLSLALNVLWRPFDKDFRLDLQTCHWEVVDNQVLENIRCRTVSIDGQNSKLQQRSTVQLLHVAHRHNVPISSLLFSESFKTTDNGTIILNTGIRVTNLPPLQKIHDMDNNGCNAITDQDIANILLCVIKGHHFNEICFEGWLMPVSLPSAFTNWMLSLALNVLWRPFDKDFRLDLQTGHWEVVDNQVMEHIRNSTVSIDGKHRVLQQRSTVQLLHVAHRHKIPISCLHLKESFSKIDAGNVILHSGLRLSCPVSVEKVVIDTRRRREMTETEVVDILMFVQQSHMLKELEFHGCLLPLTFSSESIPAELQSKNIKVFWSNYGYSLNLQSGLWEVDDVDTVKRLCTEKVDIREDIDSESLQRCTIKLLENASYHDIPISCVNLIESFSNIDAGDIILYSGLRLSCPVTVKKVVIDTEEGREMTETEVVDILMFVQRSHLLESLEFDGCLLPSISSSEAVLADFKTRDIKVLWMSCGYSLNFQSGAWEVDVDTVKCLCTKEVEISDDDSDSRQRYTIQLLENASAHDIPISCLNLEGSFSKIDDGDVILDSGLRLSCPVSVKKVVIDTETEREMTETEVVDILMFVQQSHMLEELEFKWCVLPQSIPAESIPSILKSKNVKVAWQMHYTQFQLNFQSGRWMDGDRVLGSKQSNRK